MLRRFRLPTSTQLHELAKRGAEVRLRELLEEVASIRNMFPDLNDGSAAQPAPRAAAPAERPAEQSASTTAEPKRRRKRKWTAAQRKEVAERMRKYWAARKKKA
jgi:hypothetical protein